MAKIKKEVVDFIVSSLGKHKEEIIDALNKGQSEKSLQWMAYHYMTRVARQNGFSAFIVGKDDKVSWVNDSMYVYDGNINDRHIETAMKKAFKILLNS